MVDKSTGKVQINLWHEVQRGEDGRKSVTLKKRGWRERGRRSGENDTQETKRGEERMLTVRRNGGKKIILFHPQRKNDKLFM